MRQHQNDMTPYPLHPPRSAPKVLECRAGTKWDGLALSTPRNPADESVRHT